MRSRARCRVRVSAVPDGEREHAVAPSQCLLDAPLVDRREQHFGIRVPVEAVAETFEFGSERAVVIDLAVQDDDMAARRRLHRLMSERGEIDDGKSSMPEPESCRVIEPVRLDRWARDARAYRSSRRALCARRRPIRSTRIP